MRLVNPPEKWPLGMSTCAFSRLLPLGFKQCADAGVSCIEFGFSNNGFDAISSAGRGYFKKTARWARQNNLTIWSVHLPFFDNWRIDTADGSVRARSIKNCCELIEMASEAGVQKVVIHPSGEDEELENMKIRKVCMQFSRESMHVLTENAKNFGMQLAAESLPRTCLGNTSDEMLDLVDGIEGLGICCDTNHMLRETTVDFIRKTGERIVTIHASDYDGIDERHWLPGRGVNDWAGIVQALNEAGYVGPFMYEVKHMQDTGPIKPIDIAANWQAIIQRVN